MITTFGWKLAVSFISLSVLAAVPFLSAGASMRPSDRATAATPTPSPEPTFDREAAVAKIRESIKGRESEPAGKVFKNIKNFTEMPASRILGVMQFGYSRSLGVDCTHCHTPEDWSSDEKPAKQIARDMQKMAARINMDLLKNMESLGGRQAIVNCTTCHRGSVKPATNMDGR